MKHKITLFAILMMALAIQKSVKAHDFSSVAPTGQTLYYSIVNGEAKVVNPSGGYGFTKPTGNLTIPSSVTHSGVTYTVTIIDHQAFSGCTGLTSVSVPNSVTEIGEYSFAGCSSLTTITIGSGVTSIGGNNYNGDFYNGFRTADRSFEGCTNLTSINVNASNTIFSSINGVLYNRNKTILIYCPKAYNGNLTIGSNVTRIKAYAFYGCANIDTLFINAINCLPEQYNNNNGYYLQIADTGTRVNVLMVGDEVDVLHQQFLDISGLQAINVDPDNWTYRSINGILVSMDGHTILRYPRWRQGACVIPSGITRVGEEAFKDCSGITSLTLDGVNYIGRRGFYGCTGFHTLTIPATIDTLGTAAFGGNHLNILYYNAPDCATPYGTGGGFGADQQMLFSSDSLHEVVFGANVISVPTSAFEGCTALEIIQWPSSLKKIGIKAFKNCTSLHSVTLPDSLLEIGKYGFSNCTSLSNIILNNSLNIIGDYAFMGCSVISEFTVTPNVYYIGKLAFGNCDNLHTVYYNAVSTLIQPDSCTRYIDGGYQTFHYGKYSGGGYFTFKGEEYYAYPCLNTHIERLVVGEGVRAMYAIWQYGVDTLVLPSTLDTVLSGWETIRVNNYYDNSVSDLRYVYFNCKNLKYYSSYTFSTQELAVVASVSDSPHGVFPAATNMRHVIFGDSVQSIPAFCFKDCKQVREFVNLSLPPTVNYIGSGAFEGCTQIQRVTIPNTVTTIGASPFLKCSNLHSIQYNAPEASDAEDIPLPEMSREYTPNSALSYNNVASASARTSYVSLREYLPPIDTIHIAPGVREIASCVFGYPWNQLVDSLPDTRQTYINNQSTVLRRIGTGSFANLNLVNAESLFTDSLEYIGNGAFMNSNGLIKAVLPEGCLYVGNAAFRNVQSLDSVSLPSTLQIIGTDAFRCDSSLSYLHYDCDSAYIDFIPTQACVPFANTPSLHTIDFGPHVRYLTECMFKNADGLERLVLPEGIIGIGNECFKMMVNNPSAKIVLVSGGGYLSGNVDTSSLRYVSFPASLQYIVGDAFNTSQYYPIDTIVCRGSIPPRLNNSYLYYNSSGFSIGWQTSYAPVFTDTTCHYATLMVPCSSQQTYLNYSDDFYSELWSSFTNITEFMPYDVSLTVNIDTMGTVASVCTGTQSGGHPGVRLTATPAADHRFVQWSDGVTTNPRTFYLSQDTAFEAQFAWGVLYQITARSSNNNRGTVTGSGTFVQNSIDTLVATPNYGYHFTQWNDGDTTNPRYLTVTSTQTLTASFQPNQYSLVVYSADSTQGNVSGGGTYNYYTIHSITATPTTGYHFAGWSDGVSSNPRSVRVTQDTSFTAQFAINIYTLTVSSANATMGSAAADSTQYPHGATATLTATPNYGYHFSQWNDGDTTNPRLYTMTQNKAFSAQFAPNQYTVTLATDTVRGSIAGGGTYSYLSNTTLTATPYYGYYFSSWSDGDTNNPRQFSVTGDTMITALFSKTVFHVTVSTNASWRGSAQVSNEYPEYLDTVTLTAIPNYGYHFAWWSDGQADSTDNPRQVVVTGNKNVCAIFLTNQYSLTLDVDTNIHGSVSGAGLYDYYAERTIFATPSYGYHFSAWSDGDTNNPRIITLTQDTSFTALFLPNQYTLEVLSSDTDLGQTYGSGTYNYLDTVPFGVTAIAPHYHFTHWNDGTTDSAGLIVIYGDQTLVASFVIDTHTVSVVANDDSYGAVFGEGSYPYGSQVSLTATANYGYYFVRWNNGETDNPYTLNIYGDTSITAIFAPELNADLCMVSVENGRNALVWNRESSAVSYLVFRESSTAGQYEQLASLETQDHYTWVDTSSRPVSRSYRYRLRAIDEWGESFDGQPHKTMHLTVNRGVGSNWNLVWTEYEGTQFVTYIIYRGSNPNDVQEIDRIPVGGNTTYTDENAPTGELYYQVGIIPFTPCSPGKLGDVILSNIAITTGTEGINTVVDDILRIIVNDGSIYVSIDGQPVDEFHVYDIVGREVCHAKHTDNTPELPGGVYLVKIGNYPARRVVVIR